MIASYSSLQRPIIKGRPSRRLARHGPGQLPALFGPALSGLHRNAAALGFVGFYEQLLAIGWRRSGCMIELGGPGQRSLSDLVGTSFMLS